MTAVEAFYSINEVNKPPANRVDHNNSPSTAPVENDPGQPWPDRCERVRTAAEAYGAGAKASGGAPDTATAYQPGCGSGTISMLPSMSAILVR